MTGTESSLARRKSEADMVKEHISDVKKMRRSSGVQGRGAVVGVKDGSSAEESWAFCREMLADAVIKDTTESVLSGGGLAL